MSIDLHPHVSRQYDVRLLLAAPDAPLLWDYSLWQQLVPDLTPLLSSARGRTSLRMTQFDLRQTGSPNQTYVRFGQIGWNEKAHRKWTHGSPDTNENSIHWEFYSFSAWAPGPSKCEVFPPDGFLAVRNEMTSGIDRNTCRYAYSVLSAIACDLPEAEQIMGQAFSALRAAIPSVLLAQTRRSWSGAEISGTNALTYCDTFGAPFKPGRLPVSLDMLEGVWQGLASQETRV
ncbi:MAG: hypothetical protein LBQ20_05440 [Rhodanobacter sp.]|jgi:hypothetical protein|nr:hypothetical protein [Rhodanobacter sp.]